MVIRLATELRQIRSTVLASWLNLPSTGVLQWRTRLLQWIAELLISLLSCSRTWKTEWIRKENWSLSLCLNPSTENTHRRGRIIVRIVSSLIRLNSIASLHPNNNIFSTLVKSNLEKLETWLTVYFPYVSVLCLSYSKMAKIITLSKVK